MVAVVIVTAAVVSGSQHVSQGDSVFRSTTNQRA